jgi:hypothetical protein
MRVKKQDDELDLNENISGLDLEEHNEEMEDAD